MLILEEVKEHSIIEYIGDSFAYGGTHRVVSAASTYKNSDDCPASEKGKLMIIEFQNNDTPMFIPLEALDNKDWKLVSNS